MRASASARLRVRGARECVLACVRKLHVLAVWCACVRARVCLCASALALVCVPYARVQGREPLSDTRTVKAEVLDVAVALNPLKPDTPEILNPETLHP